MRQLPMVVDDETCDDTECCDTEEAALPYPDAYDFIYSWPLMVPRCPAHAMQWVSCTASAKSLAWDASHEGALQTWIDLSLRMPIQQQQKCARCNARGPMGLLRPRNAGRLRVTHWLCVLCAQRYYNVSTGDVLYELGARREGSDMAVLQMFFPQELMK